MERLEIDTRHFPANSTFQVRSLSSIFRKGISFHETSQKHESVSISMVAGCRRMAANYLAGTPMNLSDGDLYQAGVGHILERGSREILEAKLKVLKPSVNFSFPDLKMDGLVDFIYSYDARNPETDELHTFDQIVLMRFVPWFIFKDLPADDSEPQGKMRNELLIAMWSLFTIGYIDDREIKLVGANVHYVCSEKKSSLRGRQKDNKLPWNEDTYNEVFELLTKWEGNLDNLEKGVLPDPEPADEAECKRCPFWKGCKVGEKVKSISESKLNETKESKPESSPSVQMPLNFDKKYPENYKPVYAEGEKVILKEKCEHCGRGNVVHQLDGIILDGRSNGAARTRVQITQTCTHCSVKSTARRNVANELLGNF